MEDELIWKMLMHARLSVTNTHVYATEQQQQTVRKVQSVLVSCSKDELCCILLWSTQENECLRYDENECIFFENR